MENRHIEKGARIVILFALFFPIIFSLSGIKETPLNGAYQNEADISFSFEAWFSGDFQEQKNRYLNQSFGLHHTLVRAICQLDYSLFKKANARFVVVGKSDFLYETSYIYSHYGVDFKGDDWVRKQVAMLKKAQDTMQHAQKLLLTVFAPGKGSFYPEYIPDRFRYFKRGWNNYQSFKAHATAHGLKHIDFNGFFIEQKNSSKYPLYPQFGIHWSNYGALLAFDSICKYVEKELNTDLPELKQIALKVSDQLEAPDDDVLKGMNLFKEPKTFPMAYPAYSVQSDGNNYKKLNLLVIADSFWWYIYGSGLPGQVFAKNNFWYYNEQMYPESEKEALEVQSADYFDKIREADVIILLYSESNLYKFANGFQNMLMDVYFPQDTRREEIQKLKSQIRATPHWYEDIKKKAGLKKISPDSMLSLDAIFMHDSEK